MKMEFKKVDGRGRIVLPKSWRKKWGDEVILIEFEDRIEILPRKKLNLSKFFDIVEVESFEDVADILKDISEEYG
jgi:AbrB family looped-hinge helix DNA binding protein